LVFNSFIKPDDGAIFDAMATFIHGLQEKNKSIANANDMDTVWAWFQA